MKGGVQAVTWADVADGRHRPVALAAVVTLIMGLPDDVSVSEALHTAGAVGKMQALDFTFDTSTTYTFWSGLIGGLFLSMSYFGCDQSQVQRYLTAKSTDEAQFAADERVLEDSPAGACPDGRRADVRVLPVQSGPDAVQHSHGGHSASPRATECSDLERQYTQANQDRQLAATAMAAAQRNGTPAAAAEFAAEFHRQEQCVTSVRTRKRSLSMSLRTRTSDTNYVFPTFVTRHMPIGIVGIIIAAIFAAACPPSRRN